MKETPSELARLLHAVNFAAEQHREQRRKDVCATPYINHPLAVATVLAECGQVDEVDILIAALLHDTVEDTTTTLDELTEIFGTAISEMVAEVTDDKTLAKAERKQRQIDSASSKSAGARQIKIADKICNCRDIDEDSPAGWDATRKREYLDWSAQVVEGCRGVNELLDQLFDEVRATALKRVG